MKRSQLLAEIYTTFKNVPFFGRKNSKTYGCNDKCISACASGHFFSVGGSQRSEGHKVQPQSANVLLAFLNGKRASIPVNHGRSSGIGAIFGDYGIASIGQKDTTHTESLSAPSGFDSGFVITFRFGQTCSGTSGVGPGGSRDSACTFARIIFEFDNIE